MKNSPWKTFCLVLLGALSLVITAGAIDADIVITGLANSKFKRPVRVGERLVAKAEIIRTKGSQYVVQVVSRVGDEQVFRGKFVVSGPEEDKSPDEGEGPGEGNGPEVGGDDSSSR